MKHVRFRHFFVVYLVVITYLCMFTVFPASDDWVYAAPKPSMDFIKGLMPYQVMWRPLNNIISYVLGKAPYLFPYLNHVLCLIPHFALCLLLHSLIKKVTQSRFLVFICTLFFCLSPGIVYTITNSDIFEQGLAALTGALSVFFFFRAKRNGKFICYVLWFATALLAVLLRENGLSWFLAPVMLFIIYSYAKYDYGILVLLKKNYVQIIIGIAGMLAYFALRFYLIGGIILGESQGRYAIVFSLYNIIKNYCLIIGGAITCLDPLAIFLSPRNIHVIAITAFVSLIFFAYIAVCLYRIFVFNRKVFIIIMALFVCAGYISSPFTVLAHTADNTVYEMVFMIALILAIILSSYEKICKRTKSEIMIIVVMLLCMTLVQVHKFYAIHKYTSRVHNFIAEHKDDFNRMPKNVLVFYVEDVPEVYYSVFSASLGHGLASGVAFNSVWNWGANITVKTLKNEAEADFTPENFSEYDTIFTLTNSGKLKVFRN